MNPMKVRRGSACALALLACGACAAQTGKPTRDPTVPPITLLSPTAPTVAHGGTAPSAAPAAVATAASAVPAPRPGGSRGILVVDGTRFVIEGGKRHAVGDSVGASRIERIEDDAIWLRDATGVHRMPMFGASVRRAANTTSSPPVAPANATPPATPNDTKAAVGGTTPQRTAQPGEPS